MPGTDQPWYGVPVVDISDDLITRIRRPRTAMIQELMWREMMRRRCSCERFQYGGDIETTINLAPDGVPARLIVIQEDIRTRIVAQVDAQHQNLLDSTSDALREVFAAFAEPARTHAERVPDGIRHTVGRRNAVAKTADVRMRTHLLRGSYAMTTIQSIMQDGDPRGPSTPSRQVRDDRGPSTPSRRVRDDRDDVVQRPGPLAEAWGLPKDSPRRRLPPLPPAPRSGTPGWKAPLIDRDEMWIKKPMSALSAPIDPADASIDPPSAWSDPADVPVDLRYLNAVRPKPKQAAPSAPSTSLQPRCALISSERRKARVVVKIEKPDELDDSDAEAVIASDWASEEEVVKTETLEHTVQMMHLVLAVQAAAGTRGWWFMSDDVPAGCRNLSIYESCAHLCQSPQALRLDQTIGPDVTETWLETKQDMRDLSSLYPEVLSCTTLAPNGFLQCVWCQPKACINGSSHMTSIRHNAARRRWHPADHAICLISAAGIAMEDEGTGDDELMTSLITQCQPPVSVATVERCDRQFRSNELILSRVAKYHEMEIASSSTRKRKRKK